MFTGIIEATGLITSVVEDQGNRTFWIESPVSEALKVDQSVSHDGVCLTVEEVGGNRHRLTAIAETLSKTTLGRWQQGYTVNLERCLQMNGRLDGHLVQGHVDATGILQSKEDTDGSWQLRFSFNPSFASLLIEKGSVCVNGVSLTCFDVTHDAFTVAIIPYTWEHTNLGRLDLHEAVNLEFDMIGKYINRFMSLRK